MTNLYETTLNNESNSSRAVWIILALAEYACWNWIKEAASSSKETPAFSFSKASASSLVDSATCASS